MPYDNRTGQVQVYPTTVPSSYTITPAPPVYTTSFNVNQPPPPYLTLSQSTFEANGTLHICDYSHAANFNESYNRI